MNPSRRSLADAESPEQRVEHVLDAGPAGDPVERGPRLAQRFGGDERIGRASASLKPVKAVAAAPPDGGR